MILKSIKIRNYKNLYLFSTGFCDDITTFIGENGAGKTNLFNAIHLLFSKYRETRIDESWFSAQLGNYKGHWIIFSCEISSIGDSAQEACLVKRKDNVAVVNWFFRPNRSTRRKLFEASEKVRTATTGEEKSVWWQALQNLINAIDVSYDYEEVYTQAHIFNILDPLEYNYLVGDFENGTFPNPDDDDSSKLGDQFRTSDLLGITNVTFVPAIRNVTKEFLKENNVLSKLVRSKTEKITETDWVPIRDQILEINDKLQSINQFSDLSNEINLQVNATVGEMYGQGVGYNLCLSSDISDISKSFELISSEYNRSLPMLSRSLGDNNITYFALKLLENKMLFESSKKMLNILLIEEPEAHLHKHIQKTLFSGVQSITGTQILLSTHSVHISEASNISNVVVLGKSKTGIKSFNPSNGLDEYQLRSVERYLDANRIPLLFSKSVMLVEGTAELILIPFLYKVKYGIDFDEYGISIISMDSAFFDPISLLFSEDRLHMPCVILTDLDQDFPGTTEVSTKAANARRRVESLIKAHQNNDYVSVYYSNYTFEIDMLDSSLDLMMEYIEGVEYYKNIDDFKTIIYGNNLLQKYNKYYGLVNRVGKGWYAMNLANYIVINPSCVSRIQMPDYINSAVCNLFWTKPNKEIIIDRVLKMYISRFGDTRDHFIDMLLKEHKDE